MRTPVAYSIAVVPTEALLGQPINAELRCVADSDARAALTFDHRSLAIELDRDGLSEPALIFPNRYTVEHRGELLRVSSPGGIEDLDAGAERSRSIDLGVLFPEHVLDVGRFTVTYRLEEAEPQVRPNPVVVSVASGPAAVALLIGRLMADEPDIRSRAAELLTLMTGQDFGYEPEAPVESQSDAVRQWQTWWERHGSLLPWNFESDGATFGELLPEAPSSGRSYRLGGVAFPGSHA